MKLINTQISKDHLLSFPLDNQQAEKLERNKCLIIKIKSVEILFKFYQKFDYNKSNINKKIIHHESYLIVEKYAYDIFNIFINLLKFSTEKNIPEKILCCIYEFFILIISKRDKNLIKLLESNIDWIISDYIVQNNKMNLKDQNDFYEVKIHFKIK